MKWHIYSVGKTKRDEYQVICDEYLRRIRGKISVEVKEFADEETLVRSLKDNRELIILDAAGKIASDSQDFAAMIEKKINNSSRDIVFAIGGSYGFSDAFKKRADFMLSLSSLTFPHRLARLMLLEQLYRSWTIIRNEPYSH
jgi:23S rRNA (pseudouridine1915-N3)-methyltransferase